MHYHYAKSYCAKTVCRIYAFTICGIPLQRFSEKDIDLKAISNALEHFKSIISMDVYGDNQQIIADGGEEIIPFIREIMAEDVLAHLEEGQEKQRVNFEADICFPNELADDIMQDVLNILASCGKDN